MAVVVLMMMTKIMMVISDKITVSDLTDYQSVLRNVGRNCNSKSMFVNVTSIGLSGTYEDNGTSSDVVTKIILSCHG